MKKLSAIYFLIIFAFAVSCSTLNGKTFGQTISDGEITTKINGKIVKDPTLAYLKINVTTYDGRVSLTGMVPSRDAEQRLVALSKGTRGVRSVTSNLVIQPPQIPGGQETGGQGTQGGTGGQSGSGK